ncbi:hypothetical protein EVAR_103901_1 [Eumeta japonica]|uniref:Uncharacterized protein n=1 Tax=Eumeta variegata TaxID=151549 RepID=A0A4C2AEV8_EUMVA|nr:hypothetical protein EVAR_103901_1 [Eumeta japonica]
MALMVLIKILKYDSPVVNMNGEQTAWLVKYASLPEQPWRRGSESGSREDHIRDGNIADVRFCALGHRRQGNSAYERFSDAMLDIAVREATWLYEVKHGKDLEDTFVDRELERSVYFGDSLHPIHVPETGYKRRGPGLERFSRMITNRCGDM